MHHFLLFARKRKSYAISEFEFFKVPFIQKLCTAFHEFNPAAQAGAVRDDESSVSLFRDRFVRRLRKVLDVLAANGMDRLAGSDDLRGLLDRCRSAGSVAELADLAEEVHRVNHTLTDALEKLAGASRSEQA
jgi:hypothetical protein